MRILVLIAAIAVVVIFLADAYSSIGSGAYVVQAANKDASISTPGSVVESARSQEASKVQALSEMRFSGSVALLEG
jgi:hypothetical protein